MFNLAFDIIYTIAGISAVATLFVELKDLKEDVKNNISYYELKKIAQSNTRTLIVFISIFVLEIIIYRFV